jgi:predicted ABC-type sugar transport system permease subunit
MRTVDWRSSSFVTTPISAFVSAGRQASILTGAVTLSAGLVAETSAVVELIESRTLDGHTQELIYRPTLHRP